jgi:chromosomal replication initiation ATPase DnaA
MPRQLAFDLPVRETLGRDAFFVAGPNAAGVALIDDWASWPGGRAVLFGPKGAGKTHLAQIWAAESRAMTCAASDLRSGDVTTLVAAPAVIVEDVDRDDTDNAALFHLLNLAGAEGRAVLMTGRAAPGDWPLTLPDLKSRVQGARAAELGPPDDTLLQAVILKLFDDRQIAVAPNLLSYLSDRMERSFHAAQSLVATLDAEGLAQGKPVTRALAARVLDKLGPGDAR